MSVDGSFALRWDLHEATRTLNFKSLWENDDFLDVTLVCDDDDQIGAHKVILSAASPFFKNIFKRNQHSHPLLYLRGISKKDLKALLDFIYSGETQVPQEELEEFMALATSLKVIGLVGDLAESNDVLKHAKSTEIVDNDGIKFKEMKEEKCTKVGNVKGNTQTVKYKEEDIPESIEIQDNVDENERFQMLNTSDTSLTDYDLKVSELILKSENGWTCTECAYSTKRKNHLSEHVEKHIEGFSFECENCDRTFSMKRGLRGHKYVCANKENRH